MIMRRIKHGYLKRSTAGSSFIEVAISSVALGVIVLFGLDAYVWTQAFMINDLACRDACRAAAQARPPSGANTVAAYAAAAQQAADRELKVMHINTGGPYIQNPQLISCVWNGVGPTDPLPAPPATPTVTVQTSIDMRLPFPIIFMSQQVTPGGVLVFRRSYTMPLVVLPST